MVKKTKKETKKYKPKKGSLYIVMHSKSCKKEKKSYTKRGNNKMRSRLKKYHGGGEPEPEYIDIDTTFYENYERNMHTIIEQIGIISGKHSINNDRANYFVNNQKSKERRIAARDLINNTIYITLQETMDIVGNLIDKIYEVETIKNAETIYFYSGNPNKSFYFLNVLALFFIKSKGYKEPIFIKNINTALFNDYVNPIIILDDVSYSGSQMEELLGNIYYNIVIINNKPVPNIHVAFIALNTKSLSKLIRVPTKKTKSGIVLTDIPTPFHLYYFEERLYPTLIEKIGPIRYSNVRLFFSPHTNTQPYISLYLDHKIADEPSTFMKVLLYGPIIPSNYSEQYKIFYNDDDVTSFVERDYALQKFKGKDSTPYNNLYSVYSVIFNPDFDVIDKEKSDSIEFSSFINLCIDKPILHNIQDNQDIKQMDYLLFIMNKDNIELIKKIDNIKPNSYLNDNPFVIYIKNKPKLDKQKTVELLQKLDNYKCPISFYKSTMM